MVYAQQIEGARVSQVQVPYGRQWEQDLLFLEHQKQNPAVKMILSIPFQRK